MPDPITHASLSLLFARYCFKDQKFLFVLAGLSPDIDVFIGGLFILLTGPWPASLTEFFERSLILHPGLSAAIWFVPIYGLMLAWAFRRLTKTAAALDFSRIYLLVLVGMLLHLGLDLLQTGNRPLWPLEMTAGLNVLPYTPSGRLWTMVTAVGLLILDSCAKLVRTQYCR